MFFYFKDNLEYFKVLYNFLKLRVVYYFMLVGFICNYKFDISNFLFNLGVV